MTSPTPVPGNPSLLPVLEGRTLSCDEALKSPTILRDRIAKLADDLMVMPIFYDRAGGQGVVNGGGILYNTIRFSDMLVDGQLEARAPGSEYKEMNGVDPEVRLATVSDWGGKFYFEDERRLRNDVDYLDMCTTQLANTISWKIDTAALAAVNTELNALVTSGEQPAVAGHDWTTLQIVGPLDTLTASADLPTADWSAAQLAADLQMLGVKHDVLVVSPHAAHYLRTAYGDKLSLVLESAGLELVSNTKVQTGTAYLAQKGTVGLVGFEVPLTVITLPKQETRSTLVQAYAVPAFAVNRPFNVKMLTGINC